jgi:6-phosphogluconolactonase
MSKIKYMVSLFIVLAMLVMPALSNSDKSGAVYTMTNDPTGNHVIRYDRGADGVLTNPNYFATNGKGSASIVGSNQGALVLSNDGNMLLVVNAGSNEISAFEVTNNGLTLTDIVKSGGTLPISITMHGNLVYVLNAGGSGNIVGFRLNNDGILSMIPSSARLLSTTTAGAAEVSFNPVGTVLAVTEKNTNKIDTYVVTNDGLTNGPNVQNSAGVTPFGFAFDNRGQLIDSEAKFSTVSSYDLNDDGILKVISASVPDFRAAPCWLVVTDNGKIAYTNNAHDGTTSSYTISADGKLTLLQSVAATPGAVNLDLALSQGSRFLYSINAGSHTITGFAVESDGSLKPVTSISVPAGSEGLVSR